MVKPRFGSDMNLFIDVFQELVNEAGERSKRSKEYVTVKIKLQLGQLALKLN